MQQQVDHVFKKANEMSEEMAGFFVCIEKNGENVMLYGCKSQKGKIMPMKVEGERERERE